MARILSVVGARPNFMKVAPLHRALAARGGYESRIVHTGQHYDERMSDVFFRQLELPEPDVYLGVGSASHAVQTARVMTGFEEVVLRERPDLVVVVGDVNSTVACSLVAAKLHVPVAHVEAGLRSFDRRMPEEINRIVTDHIADLLFVTERSGMENLAAEGIPAAKTHLVGNVMIDSLIRLRERAAASPIRDHLGLASGGYVLATLHRPSNVDDPEALGRIVELLGRVAALRPLVFPIHPRTRARLVEFGLADRFDALRHVRTLEPQGYLEFLHLMEHAALVLTDSGGIQEETTFLGVPCLTLRETTERPATIECGMNELVRVDDPSGVMRRAEALLANGAAERRVPPLWDGRAAERIVDVLDEALPR
jgi:UDP-N-acetylglucosamine 2-epimerase (non-hydrolysing)